MAGRKYFEPWEREKIEKTNPINLGFCPWSTRLDLASRLGEGTYNSWRRAYGGVSLEVDGCRVHD